MSQGGTCQNPKTQIPKAKSQNRNPHKHSTFRLDWDLGLGIWDLGFPQCCPALSSFNRILTKLYGGHGPVYLNVSLSKCDATSLIRRSNACSWSRCTRNAAFMIILSPMARFTRDATDTSRSRWSNSATYRSDRCCS